MGAFASPDAAAYVYAPTREGETARQILGGFRGVLVSDFYAVYDSLDCPQQKCLVHLLRDLNEDLLKHPFDAELKELAAAFGAVVRAAVETVDRHGLKKHFLAKHHREAEDLLDSVEGAEYASDVARGYQARLVKGRGKLFTFLEHDGVPWNNNNAENAVKRFVTRRKAMEGVGAFGEQGLKDYLPC